MEESYDNRRPQEVTLDDYIFVPREPTQFRVGAKTWHKDESSLRVHRASDWPEAVIVSCFPDAQIIFPSAERWFRRTAWDVIAADEVVVPLSDERLAEHRWTLTLLAARRGDKAALVIAQELLVELDRLRGV